MTRWLERAINTWLRAVAPPGWSDAVEGDLREDLPKRARGARQAATMAAIATRFTLEAIMSLMRKPARTESRKRGRMAITTDLRHAARALLRTPGFSFVAVVTLALAIGANTAIYSALSSIVLNPLPFKDGHRFVFVWNRSPEKNIMRSPSQEVIDRWRGATHIFDTIESYVTSPVVLTGAGEPQEVDVSYLAPSTLGALGIAPIVGREFVASDFEADATPVVLISHALWQSRFSGEASVVGRTMKLSETPYTIVGVMPRRFALPLGSKVMWAATRRGVDNIEFGRTALAKLAEGVTIEGARQALSLLPAGAEGEPDDGWTGYLMPPGDFNGPGIRSGLFVLASAVGLLLLIACVNVANLFLARHGGRRREIALRHALGASRGRVVGYLLAESLLLAGTGGLAGLAVAHGGMAALAALRPRSLDVLERLSLDPQALLFAAGVTLLTGLLFGLMPAITASRADLQQVLKTGGRNATAFGQRTRGLLTTAQVAVALVLLIGAGLLIGSYARLVAVDPGFNSAGVVSMRINLPASRYPETPPETGSTFFTQALSAVEALPGVESAALGTSVPLEGGVMFGRIGLEGKPDDGKSGVIFTGGYVTPGYFATLGIGITEGRGFASDDIRGREPVAVVGMTFAKTSWPEGALGKRFRIDEGPWTTVVGVANDVKSLSLADSGAHPQIYRPRAQSSGWSSSIIVRTSGDPVAVIPALKSAVSAIDPELPLDKIVTAKQLVLRATSESRFNLTLLTIFALCGLILAVVGVYGVTAISVGQREREVGIRIALGATRRTVAALVLRQTFAMLGVAIVGGTAAAWWLSRYLESMVFATKTTDAATYGAAITAIVIASMAATVVPLRRATTVDPAIVLRAE